MAKRPKGACQDGECPIRGVSDEDPLAPPAQLTAGVEKLAVEDGPNQMPTVPTLVCSHEPENLPTNGHNGEEQAKVGISVSMAQNWRPKTSKREDDGCLSLPNVSP